MGLEIDETDKHGNVFYEYRMNGTGNPCDFELKLFERTF